MGKDWRPKLLVGSNDSGTHAERLTRYRLRLLKARIWAALLLFTEVDGYTQNCLAYVTAGAFAAWW